MFFQSYRVLKPVKATLAEIVTVMFFTTKLARHESVKVCYQAVVTDQSIRQHQQRNNFMFILSTQVKRQDVLLLSKSKTINQFFLDFQILEHASKTWGTQLYQISAGLLLKYISRLLSY